MAGVSETTVSYVLNNKKSLSDNVEKKVKVAAQTLNYRPNLIAKCMRTGKSNHLVLLIDNIENSYFSQIAKSMQNIAKKHGYILSIYFGCDNIQDIINDIIDYSIDGIFIATSAEFTQKHYEMLLTKKVAVVSGKIVTGANTILFDYSIGTNKAIEYLVSNNHKKIAYLSGLGLDPNINIRLKNFYNALIAFGCDYDKDIVLSIPNSTDSTFERGYVLMQHLVNSGKEFSAVMCTNDLMAFGAMKYATDSGYNIPEDISFVGCDDLDISQYYDPGLTTIYVPKEEVGKCAMDMILNTINNDVVSTQIILTDLIIRCSVKKIK